MIIDMGVIQTILFGILFYYGWYFLTSKDDSDKSFWKRSGMEVYTDNKTGLQYLSTCSGIIPRLDETGKHMKETD